MNLMIKGKNMEVSDAIKEQIEKKIGKLDRYLSNLTNGKVELTQEMTRSRENRYVVEVTLDCKGTLLRGEERAADVTTALDAAADMMTRQIKRYKERLDAGKRRRVSAQKAFAVSPEQPSRIVRTKRFLIKPMSVEEAIDQMELLGHDFFIFFSEDDDRLNVIYRRKGEDYGLLEPELG